VAGGGGAVIEVVGRVGRGGREDRPGGDVAVQYASDAQGLSRCVRACLRVCVRACVLACVFMRVFVFVCVCMYVCVCLLEQGDRDRSRNAREG
jgi:hypothetical protein